MRSCIYSEPSTLHVSELIYPCCRAFLQVFLISSGFKVLCFLFSHAHIVLFAYTAIREFINNLGSLCLSLILRMV